MQGEQNPHALWTPHKATLGRHPRSSPHGWLQCSKSRCPNHVADQTVMLPNSALGIGLCWEDLSSFHVVSQSGQTSPAERSYKL